MWLKHGKMLFWIDNLDFENLDTEKGEKPLKKESNDIIPIMLDSEDEEQEEFEQHEEAISLDKIRHFFVGVHFFFC